jgi:hypothetical protein
MSERQFALSDDEVSEEESPEPRRPLTEAERAELAEFEARQRELEEIRDQVYQHLLLDAQACARSMYS